MPYKLIFKYKNNKVVEIKPLAPDNPLHDFEDISVLKKANKIVSMLNNDKDVQSSVERYYCGA